MATLLGLSVELQLIILEHYIENSSFKECIVLLLIAKQWTVLVNKHHILEKKFNAYYLEEGKRENCTLIQMFEKYGLEVLRENALRKEPAGERCYVDLKTIHGSQNPGKDKQEQMLQIMKRTWGQDEQTYGRLLLYYPEFWECIQGTEKRGRFIQKAMHSSPGAAIYYVFKNNSLRNIWLSFLMQVTSKDRGQNILALLNSTPVWVVRHNLNYDSNFFPTRVLTYLFSRETELQTLLMTIEDKHQFDECILKILTSCNASIAQLWSTQPELKALLLKINNKQKFDKCILKILTGCNASIAELWSTQPELRALLLKINNKQILSECIENIFVVKNELLIKLWLTQPELQILLLRSKDKEMLSRCILEILIVRNESIAKLWSTQPGLSALLLKIEHYRFFDDCIFNILAVRNKSIAKLWSTQPRLTRLLMKLKDNTKFGDCIFNILAVGNASISELWSTKPELKELLMKIEDKKILSKCIAAIFMSSPQSVVDLWLHNHELNALLMEIPYYANRIQGPAV